MGTEGGAAEDGLGGGWGGDMGIYSILTFSMGVENF